MSVTVNVQRPTVDLCLTETEQRRKFLTHGLLGSTTVALAVICAIISLVLWKRFIQKGFRQPGIYLMVIGGLDIFYALQVTALYCAPYASNQSSLPKSLRYYQIVILGHTKLYLEYLEQSTLLAYIWLHVVIAFLKDRQLQNINQPPLVQRSLMSTGSTAKEKPPQATKQKTHDFLAVGSVILLSLVTSVPLLLAWQRTNQLNPCDDQERVVMLERTQFGSHDLYILGYNRLYVMLSMYIVPSIIILVNSLLRALKLCKYKKGVITPADGLHGETIPQWLIIYIALSYVPVAGYSLLEYLDVNGLPSPGVSYILHLAMSCIRLIVICLRSRSLPISLHRKAGETPRHSRIHSLAFPHGT